MSVGHPFDEEFLVDRRLGEGADDPFGRASVAIWVGPARLLSEGGRHGTAQSSLDGGLLVLGVDHVAALQPSFLAAAQVHGGQAEGHA